MNTGLVNCERNRPPSLSERNPLGQKDTERLRKAISSARITAAEVALVALEALRQGCFCVLPHACIKGPIEARTQDILQGREPTKAAG